MDGGSGDGSGLGSDEPVPQETFHIYILSFAYGILIVRFILTFYNIIAIYTASKYPCTVSLFLLTFSL